MAVYTKTPADVYAPVDGGNNPRGASMGDALVLAQEMIVDIGSRASQEDLAALSNRIDAVSGAQRKEPVVAATTANGNLANAFENGDTIDGVVLATGNRILVKDQASAAQNGIYIVSASGAPTRATDADSETELLGATVYVQNGTESGGKSFGLATKEPIVVGTTELAFVQIAGDPEGLAGEVADINNRVGSSDPVILGEPSPVTGTALGNSTYVIAQAAGAGMECYGITVFAIVAGSIAIKVFDRAGNNWTQDGADQIVSLPAGLSTVYFDNPIEVEAGQYLGLFGNPVVAVNASTPWSGYYYAGSGVGNVSSFTASSAITSARINIGFLLREKGTLNSRVQDLERRTLGPESSPVGYVIVWAVGQSNKAGRGPLHSSVAVPAGVAYKYVRSTGLLAHLADPTGNDANAISGGGKGSFGPALADTIWRASGGALGIILINSAEGGTSITGGSGWGSSGSAWLQAVADWNTAIADILAQKLNVVGCAVSVNIGETDATDEMSAATYKAAFLDLATRLGTVTGLGSRLPIVIGQLGVRKTEDLPGYAPIRAAQSELARDNDNIFMGWTGARWLGDSDRGLMIDAQHYAQQAYDEDGRSEAGVIAVAGAGLVPTGLDS